MKKDISFKLFIIFLIGLMFRLWFIDKPEGLWNDEYVSWNIAAQTNLNDFFSLMYKNCHTPLYYFYLRAWMLICGDTDISLRLSSVLPSIISIITMFFVGKELKNEKAGLLCALITAISSFNIYFAQEARLYSLLFLFTALVTLFFIKSTKEQTNKNLLLYFTLNALLCATHTLGIIFSFFNIAILYTYFYKNNIKINLKHSIPFVVIFVIICPLLFIIATSKNLSQFWSGFSLSKIFCTFIDYYSPIIVNLQNTYSSIVSYFYKDNVINYVFIIFGLTPTIIGIYSLVKSVLIKNKILNLLLINAGLFFMTLIILSLIGKMVLVTKYSTEIYPILILATTMGLLSIKKETIKKCLIIIFIGLNLFYLVNSPDSAHKLVRPEGHKAIVDLIEKSNLKEGDFIFITYYGKDRLERYLPDKNKYNFISINKFNFNYPLFNGENYFNLIKNGKISHKEFFVEQPNSTIESYTNSNIINHLKKEDRVGFIVLEGVSFINKERMNEILKDEKKYNKTSFIFLLFSTIRNTTLDTFNNCLELESVDKWGDWTLYVYKKD